MNTLITCLESPAAERLGWVLVHSLWQLALLAGVYLLVRRLLWRAPPATRYLAACAIMVCMVLVLPLTALLVNTRPPPAGVASAVTALPVTPAPGDRAITEFQGPLPAPATAVPDVPMVRADPVPPSKPMVNAAAAASWNERLSERLVPALPWIVMAWFVGVLALAVRQLGGWILLRRLCGSGTGPVDEILAGRLTTIAKRLGVRRVVRLLSSVHVAVPSLIGHFKPVILFPASLITGLSPQQVEAILAHELAHIRRHDYLINLVQVTCETLLFYHPALWWISREIRREREHCCDDLAVRVCGDRVAYARTLAMLEERRAPLPAAAMAATGGSLLQRIRRIVGQPAAARTTRGTWLAGVLVILTVCGILPLSIAAGKADKPEFTKAAVEILIDSQGRPLSGKPAAITLTDAAEIAELAAFFPRVGTGRESSRAAGWQAGVTIDFLTSEGRTVKVSVSGNDDLTIWSEGQGDWPVKGDFKAHVEKLRMRTLKHSIGIHLVTGGPKDVPRDKAPLADLTLADEALITQDDISRYDWESHTIHLKTQAAADRILKRKTPDGRWEVGGSFVVVVDGQRLYCGQLSSQVSNYISSAPVIHLGPGAEEFQPERAVRIHPPRWKPSTDPRADGRLKKALQDLLLMPKDDPRDDPLKAVLPSGVTVELLGITEHPDLKPHPWWRADGSVLDESPVKRVPVNMILSFHKPDAVPYEFLFRLGGTAPQPAWNCAIDRGLGGRRSKDGKPLEDVKPLIMQLPQEDETLNLSFRIAAGPWKTVAVSTDGSASGALEAAAQMNGFLRLRARYDKKTEEPLLVGIETKGVENIGRPQDRGVGEGTAAVDFQGRHLADFQRFELRTRPFEVVEMVNVSLRPGKKTDARLTAVPPATPLAEADQAQQDIFKLEAAIGWFRAQAGRNPTPGGGLAALMKQPTRIEGWKCPDIRDVLNDPWGRPYVYRSPVQHDEYGYNLFSLGPDGREGTEDDVTAWSVPTWVGPANTQMTTEEQSWGQGEKGIGARLRPLRSAWPSGQTPNLSLEVRNRGDGIWTTVWLRDPALSYRIEWDGQWYECSDPPQSRGGGNPPTLRRGEQVEVEVPISNWVSVNGAQRNPLTLTPGRHIARVYVQLRVFEDSAQRAQAVSNPVEVEILPADAKPAARPSPLSFGPVIERVIPRPPVGTLEGCWALNLASGKVVTSTPAKPLDFRIEGADTLRAAGVDLYQHPYVSSPDAVNALDLRLVSLDADAWNLPAAEAMALLEKNAAVSAGRSGVTGSHVYVFSTRDGTRGVFQITGADSPTTKLRYKLVQAAGVPSVTIPPAGSRLEFRIAPSPSAMDKAELSSCMEWLKAGRVGFWWKNGRIAGRRPNHAWLPIAGELGNAGQLVTGEYRGQKYVLVSDQPGESLVPDEGRDAWGLTKVYVTKDGMGEPAVGFELDDRGAERFAALTKANIRKALAIVVDGKVVSAPVLMSELGRQGMITGRFTEQEVKDMVKALKAGMPAPPPPAITIGYEWETMQNIICAVLRRECSARLCLEHLDFDMAKPDGVTIEQAIGHLEEVAETRKLMPLEQARLFSARKMLAEGNPKTMLFDVGTRHSGQFTAASVDELLTQITRGTAYTWRKIGDTYVVLPAAGGSRLAYPVTLNTKGLTVRQAVEKVVEQRPAGSTITMPIFGTWLDSGDGADHTPGASAKAPDLELKGIPALEALCRITEGVRPDFVWELAGFKENRYLGIVRGPNGAAATASIPSAAKPAGELPWSEAVEGVQVRLRADKAVWKAGEVPAFKADVRNNGKKDRSVAQAQQLCELELDGTACRWMGDIAVKSSAFPPGREYKDISISLDPFWHSKKGALPLNLAPGKHTLRVWFSCRSVAGDANEKDPLVVSNPVEFSVEELDQDLSGVWTGGNNEADVRLAFNGTEDAELRLRRHDVNTTVAASLKRVKEDATGTVGLRLDYKRHDREVRSAIIARVERDKAGSLFVTILPIAAQIDPDWREVKKLPIHHAVEGAAALPAVDEAAWGQAADGVQIRLRLDKAQLRAGEVPGLRLDVRNLGHEDIMYAPDRPGGTYTLDFDGHVYHNMLLRLGFSMPKVVVKPGEERLDFVSESLVTEPFIGDVDWVDRDAGNKLLALEPGKHTLRVRWGDKAVSNPVEIEIAPEDPGVPRRHVQDFLVALAAGQNARALGMMKTDKKFISQIEELQKLPNLKPVEVKALWAAGRDVFAVTSDVAADHGRKRMLVFELRRSVGHWHITDFRRATEENIQAEIDQFLVAHPAAKEALATDKAAWGEAVDGVQPPEREGKPTELEEKLLMLRDYRDKSLGIRIRVPVTWEREGAATPDGAEVRFSQPEPEWKNKTRAALKLTMSDTHTTTSLDVTSPPNPKATGHRIFQVAGCPARLTAYPLPERVDSGATMLYVQFAKGTRLYMLTWVFPTAEKEAYLKLVDAVCNSVTFIGASDPDDADQSRNGPPAPPAPDATFRDKVERILDLSKAPHTRDIGTLPDLFEVRPAGSEMRPGVIVGKHPKASDFGTFYYLPEKDVFYVRHDPWAASTLTYYGPFQGKPWEVLGVPEMKRSRIEPWGEAVEGVQVRLRPDKIQWPAGETPKLLTDFRNTGQAELSLVLAPEWWELEIDGQWYRVTQTNLGEVEVKPFRPQTAHENIVIPLEDRWGWQSKEGNKPLVFGPGKHKVRVALHVQKVGEGKPVRAVSNPVEIDILPADAKPGAQPAVMSAVGREHRTREVATGRAVDSETGVAVEKFVIQDRLPMSPKYDGPPVFGGEMRSNGGFRDGKFPIRALDAYENDKLVEKGQGECRLVADGYLTEHVVVPGDHPRGEVFTVRLRRGNMIRGRVLDHTGKPVAAAGIYLSNGQRVIELTEGPHSEFQEPSVRTDEDGRFEMSGGGEDNQSLFVTAPSLFVWRADLPQPGREATIRLPEPARLRIRYDIKGAPTDAQARIELRTWDMPKWKGAVNVERWANLVVGKDGLLIGNLPPGVYDISRIKHLRTAASGTDAMLDRNLELSLESGKTAEYNFVRPTGAAISGEVIGLPDENVDGVFVYVKPVEASGDPLGKTDWKLPTFDGLALDGNGEFTSERIAPGQYKIIATAYRTETPADRGRLGLRLPAWLGTAIVTVPEAGEPPRIRVEMKPFFQHEESPPVSSHAAGQAKFAIYQAVGHESASSFGQTQNSARRRILFSDKGKGADRFDAMRPENYPLDGLILAEQPLLTEDDLSAYDRTRHLMHLKPGVRERLPKPSVWGVPFAVVVDGKPLFLGAFWTGMSSYSANMPTISLDRFKSHLPETDPDYLPQDAIRIENGLALRGGDLPRDPRRDERLFRALQQAGKLVDIRSAGEPWGEAVNGVTARLRTERRPQWQEGYPTPWVLFDLKNASKDLEVTLNVGGTPSEVLIDGVLYQRHERIAGQLPMCKPGQSVVGATLVLDKSWTAVKTVSGTPELKLKPGKHTVQAIAYALRAPEHAGQPVRAVSAPVEIDILPADAKPAGALTEAACQAMERAVAELGVSWLVARLAIEDGKLAEADRLLGEWIRALPRLRPVFPQGLQADLDEAARDGGKLQAVLEERVTAKARAMADAMDVAAGGQWRIEDAVARATLGFRTNVLKRMASALKEYEQLHNGNWPADPRSLRLDGEVVVDETVAVAISYRHAPGNKGVRWSLPDRGGLDLYAGAGISHVPWQDPYLLGGKPGPELLAAARYDNPRHLSRTLSEKHCLCYLAKEKDTISRARVFYWLGTRFSTRRDEKAGEKLDRQRANRYLAAVLQEQPQGISLPTLWSRSSLASMVDDHDQRINRSLECYDYFRSLDRTTIDRLKWPGENLDALVRLVESSRDSEAYNIVTSAAAEKDVKTLAELVRRYPGEVIAKEAARQLQRIGKGTAESPADREAATRASLAETAAKNKLVFRGLDLSSAPVVTNRSDIPDLWDAGSGQLRKGVEQTRPFGPNLSMAVYYRPDKNVFYMLVNNGLSGSSTRTEKYYGPFTGDPHQTLDLKPPLPEPAAGSPRPKHVFRDLDLTDAPMTTDFHKLTDVCDPAIPGFRAGVTFSPHLLEQGYSVWILYVADKDVFYVNCDSVWSRTEHFYGPFKGDPFKRFGLEAAVSKPVEFSVEESDPDLSGVWTGGNNEADVRLAFNGTEDAELRLRRHDVSMTVAASLKRVKEDATGTLGLRLDYKRHDHEVRSAIIARVDRDKAGALFVTILPIAAQIDPDWREVKKLPMHKPSNVTKEGQESEAKPTAPPWGEAVDGVQVRLRADKAQWQAGEIPTFKADARNHGTLQLRGSPLLDYDVQIDGKWFHRQIMTASPESLEFGPGKEFSDTRIRLLPHEIIDQTTHKHLELKPGKHTVRAAFVAGGAKGNRAVSNPVEIEILRAAPSEIAWGKTVNGLQAGVRRTSGERSYKPDEMLSYEVLIRNLSQKVIVIPVEHGLEPRPTLADGVIRLLDYIDADGVDLPVETVRLAAGEVYTYDQSSRFLLRSPVGGKAQVGRDTLDLPAGEYQVTTTINLGPENDKVKDAWQGSLTAGSLTLIFASDKDVGAHSAPPAVQPPEHTEGDFKLNQDFPLTLQAKVDGRPDLLTCRSLSFSESKDESVLYAKAQMEWGAFRQCACAVRVELLDEQNRVLEYTERIFGMRPGGQSSNAGISGEVSFFMGDSAPLLEKARRYRVSVQPLESDVLAGMEGLLDLKHGVIDWMTEHQSDNTHLMELGQLKIRSSAEGNTKAGLIFQYQPVRDATYLARVELIDDKGSVIAKGEEPLVLEGKKRDFPEIVEQIRGGYVRNEFALDLGRVDHKTVTRYRLSLLNQAPAATGKRPEAVADGMLSIRAKDVPSPIAGMLPPVLVISAKNATDKPVELNFLASLLVVNGQGRGAFPEWTGPVDPRWERLPPGEEFAYEYTLPDDLWADGQPKTLRWEAGGHASNPVTLSWKADPLLEQKILHALSSATKAVETRGYLRGLRLIGRKAVVAGLKQVLTHAYTDESYPGQTQSDAIGIVVRDKLTELMPELKLCLKSDSADIRRAALKPFYSIPKIAACDDLTPLARDPDPIIRRYVAGALGNVQGDPREAVELLHRMIEGEDALPAKGYEEHAFVKIWACGSLGRLGDRAGIPVMMDVLRNEASKSFRGNVIACLQAITGLDYTQDQQWLDWSKEQPASPTLTPPPAQPANGPDTGDFDEAEGAAWSSRPNTPSGEIHLWQIRSCKRCLSVQMIEVLEAPGMAFQNFGQRIVGKEWKWKYRGKDHRTCQHEWQDGVSTGIAVSTGKVVLVRKGEVYGAFVLTAQSIQPETAKFIWRCGTDPAGGFNTKDPNVKWSNDPKPTEKPHGAPTILFGPFEITWSGGQNGEGWIYYTKSPGDKLADDDLAICVTAENSLDTIRPRDKQWQYRRSPVDGMEDDAAPVKAIPTSAHAVVDSFVAAVGDIEKAYPELEGFTKSVAAFREQFPEEKLEVRFERLVKPYTEMRMTRPDDIGKNGIELIFRIQDESNPGWTTRTNPHIPLKALRKLVWSNLVLSPTPSAGLEQKLAAILAEHRAMLVKLDKLAAGRAPSATPLKELDKKATQPN